MGWIGIRGIRVSTDIFTTYFSCDYEKCKGACCWAKNKVPTFGGALTHDECAEILRNQTLIQSYVSPEMRKKFARSPIVASRDYSTSDGRSYAMENYKGGSCLLSRRDKNCCALELMHAEGKGLSFSIPVYCSLYPLVWHNAELRLDLSHLWDDQCSTAFDKGRREKMPVWKFVEPSIRRLLGDEFYTELEEYAKHYKECLDKTFPQST
nr:MAG TPA: Protein of unknown function (DUF3109) [Caudoviricetes sp.]